MTALAGTAAAKHVYPKMLDAVADGARYSLQQDYVYREKAATFTLRAGEYVQKYEDARAIYLIGGSHCVEMNVVPPRQPEFAYTTPFDCGIYLPRDPAKGATFFFIRGKPATTPEAGALVNAIIRAGEGSFDFPTSNKNDTLLRSQLVLPGT